MATATGLRRDEIRALTRSERVLLGAWHDTVAGDDDGRPWIPGAVRRLTWDARLRFAADPELNAAWQERERRRCQDVRYFVPNYGHVQPSEGSAPLPFRFWPTRVDNAIGAHSQAEVLDLLIHHLRVLLLKARQLGLTWIVLHYSFHRMAIYNATPNMKVLGLSKHGEDANKLLAKARRINDLLPPFLRCTEDPETRGSLSRFKLAGRGALVSLSGSPAAARSETAGIALLDEYGYIKHGKAGATSTAVEPTVGDAGQIFKLSTGNGLTGDGAALARDWAKAIAGDSDYVAVFLPASIDPARTPAWRAEKVGRYADVESFEQEHPETPDQALSGEGRVAVYPAAHVGAAVAIGRALAELEDGAYLRTMVATQGVEIGTDWGDFQTFTTYQTPLPGFGAYVLDELVQGHVEPVAASEAILDHAPLNVDTARFVASRADQAPPGTNRTFSRVLSDRRRDQPVRYPDTHVKVPFGTYKEGGGQGKRGVNTVGFLRYLLRRSFEFTQRDGWRDRLDELHDVLAIHPRCQTLAEQMRALERDPKTEKVKKPQADPRHPESGDHGPDSLVAGNYRRAEKWTATLPDTE